MFTYCTNFCKNTFLKFFASLHYFLNGWFGGGLELDLDAGLQGAPSSRFVVFD